MCGCSIEGEGYSPCAFVVILVQDICPICGDRREEYVLLFFHYHRLSFLWVKVVLLWDVSFVCPYEVDCMFEY